MKGGGERCERERREGEGGGRGVGGEEERDGGEWEEGYCIHGGRDQELTE